MARKRRTAKPFPAPRRSSGTSLVVYSPQVAASLPPKAARRARSAPVQRRKPVARQIARKNTAVKLNALGIGVEVASEGMEALMGLASSALSGYAKSTASTADDVAIPWIEKGVGTGLRMFSRVVVRKVSSELANVLESGASALNGATYTRYFDAKGDSVVRGAKKGE